MQTYRQGEYKLHLCQFVSIRRQSEYLFIFVLYGLWPITHGFDITALHQIDIICIPNLCCCTFNSNRKTEFPGSHNEKQAKSDPTTGLQLSFTPVITILPLKNKDFWLAWVHFDTLF